MKKIIALLLVLLMMATMLVGCAQEEAPKADTPATESAGEPADTAGADDTITIGICQSDATAANRVAFDDAFEALAKEKGYEVIITNASLDDNKQISDMESLITQEVDVIILIPHDINAMQETIKQASEAGIKVILHDADVSDDYKQYRDTFIVVSNYDLGVLQGNYVKDWLEADSSRELKLAYLVGLYALDDYMNREWGALDALGIDKPLVEDEAEYQASPAVTLVEDWLQVYDFNVIMAQNDDMAIGAIQALKSAGAEPGDYLILGMDGLESAASYIKEGWLTATVKSDYPAEAALSMEVCEKLIAGEEVDEYITPQTAFIMDINNVYDYYPD